MDASTPCLGAAEGNGRQRAEAWGLRGWHGLMAAARGSPMNEGWKSVSGQEALVADGDDLTVGQLVALLQEEWEEAAVAISFSKSKAT